jgi:hypothetical protein
LQLGDGDKCLKDELPPSAPFPSKKNLVAETPLFLAAKHALHKLMLKLLELGGDPSLCNLKHETCVHAVCSHPDHPESRASILDLLVTWEGIDEKGIPCEKVSINRVDDDGNTAIHHAASNGLFLCVIKLISYGAIISIVNKNNLTCCELADEKNYKELASMLELALIYQPEDKSMEGINIFGNETYLAHDNLGKLFLDTSSMTPSTINAFVEDTVTVVARYLGWMNASIYKSRAEALLSLYAWNAEKLIEDYLNNPEKVLSMAKMSSTVIPPIQSQKRKVSIDETSDRKSLSSLTELEQVNFGFETDLSSSNNSKQIHGSENKLASLIQVSDENEEEEVGSCSICCDVMYCSQDVSSFIKHTVTKTENRALSCLSGHTFCVSCWSSHLTIQVNDNGFGHLPCPAYKCGEILDITWAPFLLKSQDIVNKLKTQRLRNIIDCSGLKYCPVENCGLVLYIPSITNQIMSSNITGSPAPSNNNGGGNGDSLLPRSCTCANGHCFCLTCQQPAHSPCSCSDLLSWQKLVQEEFGAAHLKDNGTADDIANALWVAANTKRCPRCGTAIEKDEGCNHMRYNSFFVIF